MRINTGCWVDGCKRFDPDDEDGVEIKCDREWQWLTDEEIIMTTAPIDTRHSGWALDFARAIEAKSKEKNT